MVKVSNNSVLVIIDVQKGFDDPKWGKRNNPDAENVMASVLSEFRKHMLTVIHVRHDSRKPESLLKEGKPTFAFKDEVKPVEGETIITKHVNSALIGTNLEEILRKMGDPNVYYMGITTDHCVSTTARMSGNLGFKSYVIEDACAAFETRDQHGETIPAETIHNVNLASIDGEFAQVIRSEDLVF
ncbi:MAG: cysteine hydrolase [Candidatus Thermoplasmatota archaeon]|nr:cysteine hydrolase [Candidatus Thermoplasmatota archaeon]MDA8143068.1 cysteine hydrolase family protein [Thermoplasmatales archaeon]